MKKQIYLFLFLLPTFLSATLDVDVHAECAILMNAETGAILYEKKAYEKRAPASITKIATALYALHKKGSLLDQKIVASKDAIASISTQAREKSNFTVPPHWIEVGGTHIGIKAGEALTLENLLYGMMLCSGNDAANVIAEFAGEGSIPQFMEETNEYLASIGCKSTHFNSPHGHHHPDHYTTAYDMATMTRDALKNDTFKQIVSTITYQRPDTDKQQGMTLVQSNKLLRKSSPYYYEHAIGVKTGRGSRAKETLVAAAKKNDRTLILVFLNAPERKYNFEDAKLLFERAFAQPKIAKTLISAGPQNFTIKLPGANHALKTFVKSTYNIEYYKGEEPELTAEIAWKSDLSLPLSKDEVVGDITLLTTDKKILQKIPLYAANSVSFGFSSHVKNFLQLKSPLIDYLLAITFGILLVMGYFFFSRISKRSINS